MSTLTQEQKIDVALEMISEQPMHTVAQSALLKMTEMGINTNAEDITMTTEATFNNKRYKCKMLVTWQAK